MIRSWRLICLVTVLSVVSGFIFNYYWGDKALGFVSPILLSGDSGGKVNSGFSPFGSLFKGNKKTKEVSPSGSLSLTSPVSNSLGGVLGQSTQSQSEPVASNPVITTSVVSSNSVSNTPPATVLVTQNDAGTNSASSNTEIPGTSLTPSQQAVADATSIVLRYLKSGNYAALYSLMSADFKNTFSSEDFLASFPSNTVSSGSSLADPRVFGVNNEWGEQLVKIILTDGSSQSYLNIYHLENTAWTLYATQDQ